ncbi:hypothetical protein RKD52_002902 [Metabacillus sp. SLBN-84]
MWKRPNKLAFYTSLLTAMHVLTEEQKKLILTDKNR